MRMRKKPNLVPRMERCAATLITDPEALRGRWLEQFPGHQALQLELGCGKGRFTADTAAQNPDIFLDMFAPGEVSRIYINSPDPWKKSRQHKRRLTYAGFLALYANVLPLGGEIWFKTDNDPLFAFSLEQFAQEGWELREVTHDLHADGPVGVMTDYEAKFYDQGITINRCVAVKTEDTKCDLYPGTSTGCAPA